MVCEIATGHMSYCCSCQCLCCEYAKTAMCRRFGGPFCTPCATGELCPGGSRLSPVTCPANTVAPVGATTVGQCVCKPGYGRPSGAACPTCPLCDACPAGTYSAGGSGDSCTPCGRGRTTTTVASTSAAACVCAPGCAAKSRWCMPAVAILVMCNVRWPMKVLMLLLQRQPCAIEACGVASSAC